MRDSKNPTASEFIHEFNVDIERVAKCFKQIESCVIKDKHHNLTQYLQLPESFMDTLTPDNYTIFELDLIEKYCGILRKRVYVEEHLKDMEPDDTLTSEDIDGLLMGLEG